MKWRSARLLIGAAIALLGCLQGTAMAKMVLWLAMKGRVLMNGQPAAGAVLVRHDDWHWKDEKGSDRAVANVAGEFVFPAIDGSSFFGGLLPHEPVIRQEMIIEYQGAIYAAWNGYKGSYKPHSENDGRPINLVCRLDAQRTAHGQVTGLCEFV